MAFPAGEGEGVMANSQILYQNHTMNLQPSSKKGGMIPPQPPPPPKATLDLHACMYACIILVVGRKRKRCGQCDGYKAEMNVDTV